jgi:hypothetical protein
MPDHENQTLGVIRDQAVRLALLPIVLFTLFACGDGGTGPESLEIGAQGGSASLDGGAVTLSVPSGALTAPVEFTADPITFVPQTDRLVSGSAYEVGPAGTSFSRLATLTVAYDPAGMRGGVREAELRLQMVSEAGWATTTGSSVDTAKHVVTGKIEGVGRFGVVGLPVASLTVYPSRYTLVAGGTAELSTTVRGPSGGMLPDRRLSWTSSDEAVATVDSTGLVTGVGAGSAIISAEVDGQRDHASVSVFDCSAQTSIPATQCLALIAMYDGYTNNAWRTDGSLVRGTDPCGWSGVTCADGAVTGLTLVNLQGKGSISSRVGDLSGLTHLEIWGPKISGSIPSTLGSLTQLETLSLHSSSLTGSIPPELGQLSNLKELSLFWDSLTGPIPPELGEISSLTVMRMDGNQLSGTIPQALGKLSNLTSLGLADNQLTGSIPRELGRLTNLRGLALALNQLTGSIPRELGDLAQLTILSLFENQLSGTIPAEIGKLSNLQALILHGNNLGGQIPLAVAQLGAKIQSNYLPHDCMFVPPGNTGLSLPDSQDYRDADLDADGLICGVTIGSQYQ